MSNKLKNNKGITLVTVIIVLAVVVVLAGILIETSFHNYRAGMTSGYADYSYYAAESAIQKFCDLLNSEFAEINRKITGKITYNGNDEAFAREVVDELRTAYVSEVNAGGEFKGLRLSDETAATADVKLDIRYMGFRKDPENSRRLLVKLGIEADSSYVVRPYISGDRRAFAVREFPLYLPEGFRLMGAVYSIGDLMASNAGLDILGDVYVYGTSPVQLTQPQQYYYGGIYARRSSTIRIAGNAYTRSFVRTGAYGENSNSRIYISKDAIAQGIQVFGNNDRVAVMRNAYTFDDIEMNGQNSVIAVNGSYFGLSNGGDFHDNSSAIVNSAPIHHANSNASLTSRIVINGAVMINGGTFRIDDEGTALYQIEDASVAWDRRYMTPFYKVFPEVGDYNIWLAGFKTFASGFGNLFQVWNTQELNYTGNWDTWQGIINGWFARIDASREIGSNNSGFFDIGNIENMTIQGFSHYMMAANDSLYMMDKINEYGSEIRRATLLEDYVLENMGDDWENPWSPYLSGTHWNGEYCHYIPQVLDSILRPKLLGMTNVFVERETYGSGNNNIIKHRMGDAFPALTESLSNLANVMSGNKYIIEAFDSNLSDPDKYPFYDEDEENQDKYFLVINTVPERDLVLDSTTFNGIIFTTGRVVLTGSATVNGAIIAAGRGYDPNGLYIAGSAADVVEEEDEGGETRSVAYRAPRVISDIDNLGVLDSGGYAAVYCQGGDVRINFPYDGAYGLTQEQAREWLLDTFKEQDTDHPIDLYDIF